MKKYLSLLFCLCMIFPLAACGNSSAGTDSKAGNVKKSSGTSEQSSGVEASDDTKILIAVFSRADENYSVGTVEKGSTRILAEMIAEETGGRLFNIERAVPYPAAYDACTEEAKKEQDENARPALREDIDISNYDVIFLGYPNWWGDMPMPVYTFLEAHDFAGKIVVPFCTHAGSGLSGTETSIAGITGAAVRKGLAVPGTTAHNSQAEAGKRVREWLSGLNLPK
ncbi:MAG: flavodoxin [Anaerovibrio sp.]|nr:flavodoxin [Anaerovibrio sp.]